MSATSYDTCRCQHCDSGIEFETSGAGDTISCPHCKMDTLLFIPPASSRGVERTEPKESKQAPIRPIYPVAGRSEQPLIAWGCAAFLALTTMLFACLYLIEKRSLQRTQSALAMTEKSEAEFRSNVQSAIAQSDKHESQTAVQEKINAVCGIYFCENLHGRNQVDLRSDGTAVFFFETRSGEEPYRSSQPNWKLGENTVTVAPEKFGASTIFKIEQSDLIDSRGNRWLHIR